MKISRENGVFTMLPGRPTVKGKAVFLPSFCHSFLLVFALFWILGEMMKLRPPEVKWRKIVSQGRTDAPVKSEKLRPDERFAMLDWHDYIEISSHYTKEEHETIVKMLDDVVTNIPEVRLLLRLTKDPVVHFHFRASDKEIPQKVPAHEKLTLQPQLENKIIKDKHGTSIKMVRPERTRNSYKKGFQSVFGAKIIVLEPSLVSEVPAADADGNHYKPTFAELFVHELVHQAMPSASVEALTQKISNEYHSQTIRNGLRKILRGNIDGLLYSAVNKAYADHDATLNAERMTVPVANMIGKRYFGTPYRNTYYFASAKPDMNDAERDNFKPCQHSNLIPMTYVDRQNNQWRSHITAFRDFKREFPEEYREVEKNFVNDLRRAYAESMER